MQEREGVSENILLNVNTYTNTKTIHFQYPCYLEPRQNKCEVIDFDEALHSDDGKRPDLRYIILKVHRYNSMTYAVERSGNNANNQP